jgi:hypothetical protein
MLEEYHRVLRRPKGLALIFTLYGRAEWASALARSEHLWEEVKILNLTCPEDTLEHVMRTDEVGGRTNAMHVLVLVPREIGGGGGGDQVDGDQDVQSLSSSSDSSSDSFSSGD